MLASLRFRFPSFLFSTSFRRFATTSKTPTFRVTTLPNGLRIASEQLDLPTATVGMWIDTGSRYETAVNNGAAHFLEHMTFKGTAQRSQRDIELEFENMGGHLNAYTSREQTAYHAKVLAKDVPKAVGILGDILQNATLDKGAMERERDVILRESEEVNKNMEEVIMDALHAVAFQASPLARPILGSEENIRRLTVADLRQYVADNYAAPRMVLAAAGGIEHDALVAVASEAFGKLPASTAIMKPLPGLYTGSEVRMRDDTMDTAHIVIALKSVPMTSPDYFPLLVAQCIVGSWDRTMADGHYLSSRLAQSVSSSGLAHSFASFNTAYSDIGLWGIYLVSDRRHELDDLVYLVQQEWVRLCLSVNSAEVERAKTQIKAQMMLALDGTLPIAEDIGKQLLAFGKRHSLADMNAMVDAVTVDHVKSACSEHIYDRCPVVAAFGPIESCPDYNRIRASTMWLRN